MKVFDRVAKRRQRDRAAAADWDGEYDYLREHIAGALVDRIEVNGVMLLWGTNGVARGVFAVVMYVLLSVSAVRRCRFSRVELLRPDSPVVPLCISDIRSTGMIQVLQVSHAHFTSRKTMYYKHYKFI